MALRNCSAGLAAQALDGTSRMFGSLGWRPARGFALLGGLLEFAGGLLFAAGLVTPVVAGVLAAQMFAAILAVHWDKGFGTPTAAVRTRWSSRAPRLRSPRL